MPALFYSYEGQDVFKNVPGSSLVQVDKLQELIDDGKSSLALITDVSIGTSEITQLFPTFDDIIRYIHFGKGVGSVTVAGVLFSDCSGDVPGLSRFYSAFRSMRGKEVTVSIGGYAFTGLANESNCSVVGEPDTMVQFRIGIQVISDTLGGS